VNIFFLDRDPTQVARLRSDQHVVKMVLESLTMLGMTGWPHHVAKEAPTSLTAMNLDPGFCILVNGRRQVWWTLCHPLTGQDRPHRLKGGSEHGLALICWTAAAGPSISDPSRQHD
jgi:hypothetical protein